MNYFFLEIHVKRLKEKRLKEKRLKEKRLKEKRLQRRVRRGHKVPATPTTAETTL